MTQYAVYAWGPYDHAIYGPMNMANALAVSTANKTVATDAWMSTIDRLGQSQNDGPFVIHCWEPGKLGIYGRFADEAKAEQAAQSAGFKADWYSIDRLQSYERESV